MSDSKEEVSSKNKVGLSDGLISDNLQQWESSLPIGQSMMRHLHQTLAKDRYSARDHDYYVALVLAIRERLVTRSLQTQQRSYFEDRKRVYYLSLEYLTGRSLSNALVNLGLLDECSMELHRLGIDLDQLIASEWEAGLGNGGLGRLAACMLDSMSTLGIPAYGYGIRYEYGIFSQKIVDGYQVELPDDWLRLGNPWEIARPEDTYAVRFGGEVHSYYDTKGRLKFDWVSGEEVIAMAYDTPVPGYLSETVNVMRLWSAYSANGFSLSDFNRGDFLAALERSNRTENISRVLYPNDNTLEGRELRLRQEYFFVSASIQDILRRFKKIRSSFEELPHKVAIQLNDTHPALAVPELMRILVDEEQLPWEQAWGFTESTFAYTNHTLMPEALEVWPEELIGRVLPRHLQIIHEINRRFIEVISLKFPADSDRLARMSVVECNGENRIRMAHLAVIGSHAVNGVSRLHSRLLKEHLFSDFQQIYPDRFISTTNGITPRRWLKIANPGLTQLIENTLGPDFRFDLQQLELLSHQLDRVDFLDEWIKTKNQNKQRLAKRIQQELGIVVSPESLFDCQVKRVHEYKRQLLNLLHAIVAYNRIRSSQDNWQVDRTIIIAGKAAAGYAVARSLIKLIHDVAEVINRDPKTEGRLKLVFLSNYNVSLAENVFPATDLSQQISTAGTEASGTGNMKAMMNGSLTIGTWDGANIEIAEAVGPDNIFTFGKTAEQVAATRQSGYDPSQLYRTHPELREAIDMLRSGYFTKGNRYADALLNETLFWKGDPYLVLDEFSDYYSCQQRVAEQFHDRHAWAKMSIINVARSWRFSSDRTVSQYAREIWGVFEK
jgi:starch phosphorylase